MDAAKGCYKVSTRCDKLVKKRKAYRSCQLGIVRFKSQMSFFTSSFSSCTLALAFSEELYRLGFVSLRSVSARLEFFSSVLLESVCTTGWGLSGGR